MKFFSAVLLMLAAPASALAQSSLPPYVAAAIADYHAKILMFVGCSLAGALFGVLLARRIDKKRRAMRDLTFSLSTLAGSVVGLLSFLGKL
uniref:hypothetical protein n=1 Tax=Pseudomonas fluorescens TaxID=294 RepID=UPI0025B74512|nr:hypothetical protein [Pseudomonas fluorescens]